MQYKEKQKEEIEADILKIFRLERGKLKPGSLVLHFNTNGQLKTYELHAKNQIYPHQEINKT